MKAVNVNSILIESYIEVLKNLSPDSKLDLIAKLSASMKANAKASKAESLHSLFGSLVSKQSADEIIAEIKNARTFKSKRAEF